MTSRFAGPARRTPRMLLLCTAVTLVTAGCGGSTSSSSSTLPGPLAPASDVVSQVQASVPGLTGVQTAQGMGGILGYAKTKMPPAQFSQVASAFPGADAMISEGTKLGMPSEMTGLTSLRGTMQNAGISTEQFNQMVPAMSNIVNDKSGPEVAQAFSGVFK